MNSRFRSRRGGRFCVGFLFFCILIFYLLPNIASFVELVIFDFGESEFPVEIPKKLKEYETQLKNATEKWHQSRQEVPKKITEKGPTTPPEPTTAPTRTPAPTSPSVQLQHVSTLPPFSFRFLNNANHTSNHKRDNIVEIESLCISPKHQFFYIPSENTATILQSFPSSGINLKASANSLDLYMKLNNGSEHIQPHEEVEYIEDRVLFVIGGIWVYHLSHFFINNYMPLVNVLNNYYGTNEWLNIPRDISFDGLQFDSNFRSLKFVKTYERNTGSLSHTICYKKTVMGLNSTCSCCGCHNQRYLENSQVYRQTREFIYSSYMNQSLPKIAFELPMKIKIIQRAKSRSILNINLVHKYIVETLGLNCTVVTTESSSSFEDQIRMMSDTTILIASHGNALGNAFWLPDHACVIEVQSVGQAGNLWYPITYSRGNETHPLYYHNISCYDEFDQKNTESCNAFPNNGKDINFRVNIPALGKAISNYVEYHRTMSLLGKESWSKLKIDSTKYWEETYKRG